MGHMVNCYTSADEFIAIWTDKVFWSNFNTTHGVSQKLRAPELRLIL